MVWYTVDIQSSNITSEQTHLSNTCTCITDSVGLSICLPSVFLSSVTLVCAHCHTHIHIHTYTYMYMYCTTHMHKHTMHLHVHVHVHMHTDKTYTPHVHAQCFIHMHRVAVHVYILFKKKIITAPRDYALRMAYVHVYTTMKLAALRITRVVTMADAVTVVASWTCQSG